MFSLNCTILLFIDIMQLTHAIFSSVLHVGEIDFKEVTTNHWECDGVER